MQPVLVLLALAAVATAGVETAVDAMFDSSAVLRQFAAQNAALAQDVKNMIVDEVPAALPESASVLVLLFDILDREWRTGVALNRSPEHHARKVVKIGDKAVITAIHQALPVFAQTMQGDLARREDGNPYVHSLQTVLTNKQVAVTDLRKHK